jgi:molecular chaperone GrpE (heat shock protein)
MQGIRYFPVLVGLIFALSLSLPAQTDRNPPKISKKTPAQSKEKTKQPVADKTLAQPPAKVTSPAINPPKPTPPPPTPAAVVPVAVSAPESPSQDPIQHWILWGVAGLSGINTLLILFTLIHRNERGTSSLSPLTLGQNNQDDLQRLSQAFAGLHEALDKKDEEIRRHQRGYDQKILKTLLGRLVHVQLYLEDALSEKPPKESTVQTVADELAMVLDEYGIRSHDPKGELYRATPGVATNPKTVTTDRTELKGRIAEVRQKGFLLKTPGGVEVLLPAKVTVYD